MRSYHVVAVSILAVVLPACSEGDGIVPKDKGTVKIATDPGDAKLSINGKRKGSSPAEPGQTFAIKLPEGEYVIEAVKNNGGPKEHYGKKEIYVSADTLQTISLKLKERAWGNFRESLKKKYSKGIPVPAMVQIPGGTFQMGCLSNDKSCRPSEKPVRRVAIKAFELSMYEVTFEQWDACVAFGECHYPDDKGYYDDKGWGRGKRPVINVSWDDITKHYLPWLNKVTGKTFRLPSEAEWEYAARAGTTTKYYWGNEIGKGNAHCEGCGSRWDNNKPLQWAHSRPTPLAFMTFLATLQSGQQIVTKSPIMGPQLMAGPGRQKSVMNARNAAELSSLPIQR